MSNNDDVQPALERQNFIECSNKLIDDVIDGFAPVESAKRKICNIEIYGTDYQLQMILTCDEDELLTHDCHLK